MNRAKRRNQSNQDPILRLLRMAKNSERNDPRLVELLSACRKGNLANVRRLLNAGLSPNEIAPGDATMDTAVSAAVYAQGAAILRVLAAAGADLDAGHSYTPLVTTAGWRHLPLVLALIEGGANVNQADSSGTTPLRAAVLGGHSGANGNPLPNRSGAIGGWCGSESRAANAQRLCCEDDPASLGGVQSDATDG